MNSQAGVPVTVFVHVSEPLLQAGIHASLVNEPNIFLIDAEPSAIMCPVDVLVTDSVTMALFADKQRAQFGPNLESARLLVLTSRACERAFQDTMKRIIQGALLTTSPAYELVAAVRALARGGRYICPGILGQMATRIESESLTTREDQVLQLLAAGRCNKSIAIALNIAVDTVKTHVKSILQKLNASSRTEAARIAAQRGIVEMDHPSYAMRLQFATRAPAGGMPSHQRL